MSVSQYKRYIWLVDTIRSAGKISREEIDRKWASARINDNHEPRLADSTFFRYKNDVEELFDIEILCDRANGLYYIGDSDWMAQSLEFTYDPKGKTLDPSVDFTFYVADGTVWIEGLNVCLVGE